MNPQLIKAIFTDFINETAQRVNAVSQRVLSGSVADMNDYKQSIGFGAGVQWCQEVLKNQLVSKGIAIDERPPMPVQSFEPQEDTLTATNKKVVN